MGKFDFVQDGLSVDHSPSAALASGDIVILGDLIGVVPTPVGANALAGVQLAGVFDVAKSGSAGPVFAVGDEVFYDLVNAVAKRTGGSGCVPIGTCIATAGASDTKVRTRLNPYSLPATQQNKLWEDVSLSVGSKTLDIEDSGKVINITAGSDANVVTLPATASGQEFTIRCGVAGQRIAISPNAADKIFGPDLAGVDNKDRILTAATARVGDYITLRADAINGFVILAERGVWTNEP
jgi:predicted RecA/RadA family phage recombinase